MAFGTEDQIPPGKVSLGRAIQTLDSWPDEWDLDEYNCCRPELWVNYDRLVIPD